MADVADISVSDLKDGKLASGDKSDVKHSELTNGATTPPDIQDQSDESEEEVSEDEDESESGDADDEEVEESDSQEETADLDTEKQVSSPNRGAGDAINGDDDTKQKDVILPPGIQDIAQRVVEETLESVKQKMAENVVKTVETASSETPSEQAASESAQEQVPEPAMEQVPEPVTEQISEQATEQIPEPATEQVPEPETEQIPEPATEQIPEPATEQIPEPATEQIPEPATEQIPEPATEATPTESDTKDDSQEGDGWMLVLGHDKLKKRTLEKGAGISSRPTRGQIVTVSYHATWEDGIVVDKHDRQTITLGDEDVIQALDLCVSLMELNEKCEVVTHPQYAYGSRGRLPDIPADTTLTYTVDLLVVEEAPQYSLLPVQRRVTEADKKRLRGNELYSREEFSSSINSYNRALEILSDDSEGHRGTAEQLQELLDTRLKCYNNMAAAQLKVEAWDAAVMSCEEVLKVQPDNVKALFRKGKCLASKGDLEPAITVLRRALKLEPETKIIHQELSRLVSRHKSQEDSTRAMYQKMLGTKTAAPKAAAKTDTKSSWWLYAGGATLAALLAGGIAAYRYTGVN